MKYFCRGFALAMAATLGVVLGLCSLVVQPSLRFLASACDKMASGIDKLDRELAHKFAEDIQFAAGVNSGLQRESNGYRQSKAEPVPSCDAVTA